MACAVLGKNQLRRGRLAIILKRKILLSVAARAPSSGWRSISQSRMVQKSPSLDHNSKTLIATSLHSARMLVQWQGPHFGLLVGFLVLVQLQGFHSDLSVEFLVLVHLAETTKWNPIRLLLHLLLHLPRLDTAMILRCHVQGSQKRLRVSR